MSPPIALQPLIDCDERMFAHSDRFVLPRTIAPASRRRATSGASRFVTLSLSASEPAVVGSGSAVSMLSLIRTGMPCSGPRSLPVLRSASRARASSAARGLRLKTLCSPLRSIVSMRFRYVATSASDVVRPAASSTCNSAIDFSSTASVACACAPASKSNTSAMAIRYVMQAPSPDTLGQSLAVRAGELNMHGLERP